MTLTFDVNFLSKTQQHVCV